MQRKSLAAVATVAMSATAAAFFVTRPAKRRHDNCAPAVPVVAEGQPTTCQSICAGSGRHRIQYALWHQIQGQITNRFTKVGIKAGDLLESAPVLGQLDPVVMTRDRDQAHPNAGAV